MLHWLDASIILLFIVYVIYSGFSNKEQAGENLTEYFLAGRTLPGWKAGISMAATQFAADTPLLVTGLIATSGVFSLWRLWIYGLSFLVIGFFLAGPWRRANVLTDAELSELRYDGNSATLLRGVKAIYFGTIFNCTVLAMVLLATTRITEPFLHWDQWLNTDVYNYLMGVVESIGVPFTLARENPEIMWTLSTNNLISILTIVFVTTLYSTTGGLRSVVQTDILQFFIMMIATALYCYFVIDAAGGIEGLYTNLDPNALSGGMTVDQLLAFTPSQAFEVGYGVLAVIGLQWIIQMNSDGTGYLAQRSMACRSEKDARFASVLFAFLQVFVRSLLWLPIGIGLFIIFPPEGIVNTELYTANREATFIIGIKELLPIGVKGLMITSMLAALASTVDTHLNWGSGYWTNDIYKRIVYQKFLGKEPNPKSLVWVARFSNIMILAFALIIMANLDSIQSAWKGSLLIGAAMGVPLILRWFWWQMNAWGELGSMVVASIFVPVFIMQDFSDVEAILLIALISLGVTLLAVFVKGPEDDEVLKKFYDKVQPPGYWGPYKSSTQPSLELKKVGALLLCALSLFALLVGVGTLLVRGTPPGWLPSRAVWSGLCIAIGMIAIPWWVKYLRGANERE